MTLDVVILAAGQGTRMKSRLPKVLHLLAGRPLVQYSIDAVSPLVAQPPVLVIGHGSDAVRQTVGNAARYALQDDQLGTAHAVSQAQSLLQGKGATTVLVMYADMPLLRPETLKLLVDAHQEQAATLSLLTMISDRPRGFGRIIRDTKDAIAAVVEDAQATPDQKAIRELNVGVYCIDSGWLWDHLDKVPVSPQGEYYLTDLVEMAVSEGQLIHAIRLDDPAEALGINTRVHLAEAESALRQRTNRDLMLSGVSLVDPATTYIHPTVRIGFDTIIEPNTHIYGQTSIGEGCHIGPHAVIEDATLEDNVYVGPFAHLRRGAYLESGVHMGNFGEIKNSRLRQGVRMGHFSYIGDGDIGENTNIGAGTITCNYDGKNKHKTVIGKNVFIGSDTMLVAPVTLGDGSRTGAGSVVTRDVPPGGLVYGVPARPPVTHKKET